MKSEGKVVVLTGASSGIGKAAAEILYKKGCVVYDLSRHDGNTEGAKHIDCDVTSEEAVRAAIERVISEAGRIDGLLCCAGFGISGAVEYTTEKDALRQFDVNFFGVDRAVRASLPQMREQGGGRIVIVSSAAAVLPIPFQTYYSAVKSALNTYARALQGEVKPFGITVTALLPGDTKTGFTDARNASREGDDVYAGRITRSVGRMEKDEQSGVPAEKVGALLARLATKKRVSPLVAAGFAYKAACFFPRFFPTAFVDKILASLYAK